MPKTTEFNANVEVPINTKDLFFIIFIICGMLDSMATTIAKYAKF